MPAQNIQRKKQFIDRAVQGALLLHFVGHWVFFLIAVSASLFFIDMLIGDPRDAWKNVVPRHGPILLVMLVLTPIFIRDLFHLSNRFAGPMVRLRRVMHDLAEGREVSPIHFRDRDFWKDLATDFNRVAERVQASATHAPESPISSSSSSRDESQYPSSTAPHTVES